jgi:alpha-L-fucosidase 2
MSKIIRIIVLISFLSFSKGVISQNNTSQLNATHRTYEIWDDQPAPNRGKDYSRIISRGYPTDSDWEAHSYPIGNGYMGANIFGRTDMERIQITDKTLTNGAPYGHGGLTNFGEVFLEFDHYEVKNYKRSLNLNEAILNVSYEYEGVKYTREYLANYPQNVIAIKLKASKKAKLSLTVSAVVPYLRSADAYNHSGETIENIAKYANTTAQDNLITFAGNVPSFSLNFEGQVKIINEGGKLIANNENGSNEIRIIDANSATILISTGTNYELNEDIFLQDSTELKLNSKIFPHKKVTEIIENASLLGYKKLKESHLKDYQNLFSRVNLEVSPSVPNIPTKTLVENYKQDASDIYLEELMFHFGRYLLIASSRKGTLPSTLQGVWSQYHVTPWSGGYWHNINVQMNYWGAFNTNLAETFTAYQEYFNAFTPKTYQHANTYIKKWYPSAFVDSEKGNGWAIGTGSNAYHVNGSSGHSGPGTGGFTTKLFWDRFEFTPKKYISYFNKTQIYLNPKIENKIKVLKKIKQFSRKNDGIKKIYIPSLNSRSINDDVFVNSYNTEVSGDIIYEMYSGWMVERKFGTTHASNYSNDSHVPLIWYGKNINRGETSLSVKITQIDPTISMLLNIPLPNVSDKNPIVALISY